MHEYNATQSIREPLIFQIENQKGFLGKGTKLNVLFNSEGCKQKEVRTILLRNNKFKIYYLEYNSGYFYKCN